MFIELQAATVVKRDAGPDAIPVKFTARQMNDQVIGVAVRSGFINQPVFINRCGIIVIVQDQVKVPVSIEV